MFGKNFFCTIRNSISAEILAELPALQPMKTLKRTVRED
jgi:hypothetical protein